MPDDPALWSATEQAEAIRDRRLSSVELLECFANRIHRFNPDLGAICTLDLERAGEAAARADQALARGESMGPLHGLPITIKDALETSGLRSTGGAIELRENIPQRDAPVVAAVKAAGAFVIGKTNLPRWSGDIQSYNEMFGTTRNPWNPERVPGGSSGGAATAVATGMTAFEIGTDIGGSIRFPSAFCGVFGHKPSFGIIPSQGYLDHEHGGGIEADINVLGPIARSAEDLELLLGILKRKSAPWLAQLGEPPEDVRGLRVAAWLDDGFCPVDREVFETIDAAAGQLEKDGFHIDREARPALSPREATDIGSFLLGAALAQTMGDDGISHRQYLGLHGAREDIRLRWAEFFEDFDALLMPVSFVPPFPHQQEGDFGSRILQCNGEPRPYADLIRWTLLTGMAYLPSTVPPIGLGSSGLPIGIQVVGPYGSDLRTIRLAGHLASLSGGFRPPPLG
ncbi:MAG: amidase [bacterium]|nr:amidase [bacterium]